MQFRVAIAVLLFLAVSSDAIAQATTTLPPVRVRAVLLKIDNVTLCEGSACADLFNAITVTPPLVVEELSDLGPTEPDAPECSGIAETRETAVWAVYKAVMLARFGTNLIGWALADKANHGKTLTIVFSNGSTGLYERSNSAFNGSHGFFEIKSPSC